MGRGYGTGRVAARVSGALTHGTRSGLDQSSGFSPSGAILTRRGVNLPSARTRSCCAANGATGGRRCLHASCPWALPLSYRPLLDALLADGPDDAVDVAAGRVDLVGLDLAGHDDLLYLGDHERRG